MPAAIQRSVGHAPLQRRARAAARWLRLQRRVRQRPAPAVRAARRDGGPPTCLRPDPGRWARPAIQLGVLRVRAQPRRRRQHHSLRRRRRDGCAVQRLAGCLLGPDSGHASRRGVDARAAAGLLQRELRLCAHDAEEQRDKVGVPPLRHVCGWHQPAAGLGFQPFSRGLKPADLPGAAARWGDVTGHRQLCGID